MRKTFDRIHLPPTSERNGLRIHQCGFSSRPWWDYMDGVRWTGDCWKLVLLRQAGAGYIDGARHSRLTVEAGDALLIPPHVWHYYGPWRDSIWHETWVFFSGPTADAVLASQKRSARRPLLHPRDPGSTLRAMEAITRAAKRGRMEAMSRAWWACMLSLHDASESGARSTASEINVQPLLQALRAEPQRDWDFNAEARALGISTSTLRRAFAAEVGVPPQRYLAERRVDRALQLLRAGATVAEAGDAVGYEDPAYFSRRFKQIAGAAPRDYPRLADGRDTDFSAEA